MSWNENWNEIELLLINFKVMKTYLRDKILNSCYFHERSK